MMMMMKTMTWKKKTKLEGSIEKKSKFLTEKENV